MKVKRIVPNIHARNPSEAERFYGEGLGLTLLMDLGWIATYGAPTAAPAQLSIMADEAAPAAMPDISIEVDDLDAALASLRATGFEPEYGPKDEPWGVRRFFVRDPFGTLVNILSHMD
jgi:catechol 2,3-dioxygenase-like lactoylglutathione lyase family enzyme